jgi:hypothetical protein
MPYEFADVMSRLAPLTAGLGRHMSEVPGAH